MGGKGKNRDEETKGKGRGKGKATMPAGNKDAAFATPALPDELKDNNRDHIAMIMEWKQLVDADPLIVSGVDSIPLDVADGGSQACFKLDVFATATTVLKCGGAFSWADLVVSPTPGVTLNSKKIMQHVNSAFPGGQPPTDGI